jgi:uncharacterized protein (DUF2147 family)
MKKLLVLFIFLGCFQLSAQSVIGKWKTVDDKTGKPKSIIEIYEKGGKIYGKITDILNPAMRNGVCTKCGKDYKDKPILGMVIITDMKKDDDEYNGGKILDPESGTEYKCILKLEGKDKLEVRGYVGFALIGRSQTWIRVK